MRRFFLLLLNEFKQSRSILVVHLIAVFQPTLMYLLMSAIMVVPTFDMRVVKSPQEISSELIAAMERVRSPIGPDYIQPILVDNTSPGFRQVVEIITKEGETIALQRFGHIDSNLVKNLRNRLTAAGLVLWNQELGSRAVTINEHPWLSRDIPYTVYFGMAMILLAAYLAAAMIGGYSMASEFEAGTILEYRLSPVSFPLILAAKLTRLVLTGLGAGGILYCALGLITGFWSSSTLAVFLIPIPLTIMAACIGILAGLLTRSSLPSFLVSLATAFAFWLIGSGFGLAAGFSNLFEQISRSIPNTPVIEMLFPYFYFGRQVAVHPTRAALQLSVYTVGLLLGVFILYQKRVLDTKR